MLPEALDGGGDSQLPHLEPEIPEEDTLPASDTQVAASIGGGSDNGKNGSDGGELTSPCPVSPAPSSLSNTPSTSAMDDEPYMKLTVGMKYFGQGLQGIR